MGGLWVHLLLREILSQIRRYTYEISIDNVPLCLRSPATCCQIGSIGRLDGYDASTFRSSNPSSPALDSVLLGRLRAGERDPARFVGPWTGQWDGAALRQIGRAGVCSLFQLRFAAPPGSLGRGLLLLVVLTVVSLGGTTALAMVVAVRPLVSRLLRLRRTAELLGSETGFEPGEERDADEIGRLARILARAHARVRIESERLRARQNALERHLGDIAHDLRTPLTSAQIALEQAVRSLPRGEARRLVRRALTDTVYTAELTENLRLATQLREGADPLDGDPTTELAAIVERVVARFTLLGRHRGVVLEGAWPKRTVVARGHTVWAEQAVANVVHNAVTHGHEGGHVAVVLEIVGDVSFRLTVVDDGPGIPAGEIPHVAERSFRSHRARQYDPAGSGLGLAIASEVCRRSAWSLRFAAEEPQGLRVTIAGALVRPTPRRDRPARLE
jgi:signal transduction histidine kinase